MEHDYYVKLDSMIATRPDQQGYRRISASSGQQLLIRALLQFEMPPSPFYRYQLWSSSVRSVRIDPLWAIPAEYEFFQLRIQPIHPLPERREVA